jgi:hypothetical protein
MRARRLLRDPANAADSTRHISFGNELVSSGERFAVAILRFWR